MQTDHSPSPPTITPTLTELEQQTCALLSGTAEEFWDVAATIKATGEATADDWEVARASASHMLAQLDRVISRKMLGLRRQAPQPVVSSALTTGS
jgi:hypothetical protein